jgi:hypothetical protein
MLGCGPKQRIDGWAGEVLARTMRQVKVPGTHGQMLRRRCHIDSSRLDRAAVLGFDDTKPPYGLKKRWQIAGMVSNVLDHANRRWKLARKAPNQRA